MVQVIPWGRPKAKREPVDVPESGSAEMSERERRYHESNQWGR